MSGSGAGVEGCRPRPLSGGLWTLFSWLRRDDHCSSDSLSSVGSDRTAASFAFLPPDNYTTSPPLIITPAPPTDSYKKRVRDRNARRQYDRDITLLRKYGLHGFDAFSLPNARRSDRSERDRRATSEILQRRAHVPGKRRAPLPPSASNSLPRPRKRPAPQPPGKPNLRGNNETETKENYTLPMNSRRIDKPKHNEETMGCKPEKYSKKDTKESKPRQDRSFLKQIFENRKRNSAIETSSVKLLPSISELDKQAHEIIEKYKLKELEHNVSREGRLDGESAGSSKRQVEAWICTRCLRKYNASVITCLYCLPLENALLNNSTKSSKVTSHSTQTSSSNRSELEDKEKLKEILKEMKDSLPKKTTTDHSDLTKSKVPNEIESKGYPRVVEAPTLRIGSSISAETKSVSNAPSASSNKVEVDKQKTSNDNTQEKSLATIENVVITQPVVLVHTKDNIVIVDKASKKEELEKQKKSNPITRKTEQSNMTKTEIASKLLSGEKNSSNVITSPKPDISIPLKISSLLNPMYVPKSNTSTSITNANKEETKAINIEKDITKSSVSTNTENKLVLPSLFKPSTAIVPPPEEKVKSEAKKEEQKQSPPKENIIIVKRIVEAKRPVDKSTAITATSQAPETSIVEKLDQHSRRRNLINQLEQSIAKGDEKAAADAAVKLAQLRLSCSVLSFSSQIVSEASTSLTETAPPRTDTRKREDSPVKKDALLIESIKNKSVLTEDTQNNQNDKTVVKQEIKSTKVVTDDTKDNQVDKTVVKQENSSSKVLTYDTKNNQAEQTAVKQENSDFKLQASTPETSKELKKPTSEKNVKLLPVQCEPSTSKDINERKDNNEDVPILVWVEDKEATRGPVQLHVARGATMGELRRRAEASLGLAVRMQRWIIGRALCSDDNTPLVALAGPDMSAPFYLCLVESEKKEPENTAELNVTDGNVYNELVRLEQQALVATAEPFECGVCMEQCAVGDGVVLRECVHSFCKGCLADMVRHSVEAVVSCPATGCRGVLQEREIKGLVSGDEYERWLARGLAAAESGARHAFHCRTRDCAGWALCEPGVRRFPCPVCKRTNCVPCQAIHEGETCDQHREKLQTSATTESSNQTDEGTRALIESLIARGEALECPECSAIITKKWGCDWIKCSACKTEICWVTRGRRWGPAGRGDTSAGCRCGLDGKRCHPSCGYCH